jgi:hypothetical protein
MTKDKRYKIKDPRKRPKKIPSWEVEGVGYKRQKTKDKRNYGLE